MFHFFRVCKSFMHKRGMPRFSVEKFWSHNTGNPRSGTILCFRKVLVSNNFLDKRGGDCQDFLSEIFCRPVPKSFIAEPFCAVFQKIFGSDKVY